MTAPSHLKLHDRRLALRRPLLMGVLNVTPDSFSDGGIHARAEDAVEAARSMILDGADLIDLGAESSRPGAEPVPADEEIRRLEPVLSAILDLGAPVSVDTCKPEVADHVLRLGAHLINDIGGLGDDMLEVVARHGAPAIVMHMAGRPRTMQQAPAYEDVVSEVFGFLRDRVDAAAAVGVQTVADVGFGFGKALEHNLALLRELARFRDLGAPLLLGTSRKSSLGLLTGADVLDRVPATLATASWALERGVRILRVHDVAAHRQLLQTHQALAGSPSGPPAGGNLSLALTGIPVDVHLGVPDEERSRPQRIAVDASLHGDFADTADNDTIESTIDYTDVPRRITALAAREPVRLLETLARRIADDLFDHLPRLHALDLQLHKPQAAAAVGAGDVILRRSFQRPEGDRRHDALLGLGSNLGDRPRLLEAAVAELRRLGTVVAVSDWIETEPEGGVDQPLYLNGAVRLRTALSPAELLEECLSIELRFGRKRSRTPSAGAPAASRTLDLDLLLHDDHVVDAPDLVLPHPALHRRPFVLAPLVQIAPDARHPVLHRTIAELRREVEA